jgi:hypothetical protein
MNAGNQYGAMVPISHIALNNNLPTFSNIPQTFQDLRIVIYGRSNFAATVDSLALYLNGVTSGGLYSQTRLGGNGSAASSDRQSSLNFFSDLASVAGATSTSGIFSAFTVDILNYANTSTFKTILLRAASDANGSGKTELTVGLYRSTSAITTITGPYPYNTPQQYSAGSTATLYGIRAVSS